jgi:hypothetical protein
MKQNMILTMCLLISGLLVPALEVNETHLMNPAWPAHARLHEAWQLITNSGICLFSLWLIWARQKNLLASTLGLIVVSGFLLAWIARDLYGGSMAGTTSSGLQILGVDSAVAIMLIVFSLYLFVILNIVRENKLHRE